MRVGSQERKAWGLPYGVPEGSDFRLSAIVTNNGSLSTGAFTSSGTWTVTISDSVLNGGTALLTDEVSDSVTTASGFIAWDILDTQSADWESGDYNGDIKLVDSGAFIRYFPVSLKVRSIKD